MKILFYKPNKRSPVQGFIRKLQPDDRLRILACLRSIEELGLDCPRVQFRQIRGKLWEIKIKTPCSGYRIFYVVIKQAKMVLLHTYKKKTQRTPSKEIEIAEKRMQEVLDDEKIYSA